MSDKDVPVIYGNPAHRSPEYLSGVLVSRAINRLAEAMERMATVMEEETTTWYVADRKDEDGTA